MARARERVEVGAEVPPVAREAVLRRGDVVSRAGRSDEYRVRHMASKVCRACNGTGLEWEVTLVGAHKAFETALRALAGAGYRRVR